MQKVLVFIRFNNVFDQKACKTLGKTNKTNQKPIQNQLKPMKKPIKPIFGGSGDGWLAGGLPACMPGWAGWLAGWLALGWLAGV